MWADFIEHSEQVNADGPKLNALICNAGALSNSLTVTAEGVETTLATHLLFGTYLLGTLALPILRGTPGSRLVAVSSGGMYNTKFPDWDVAAALQGKYDGQLAYAYAKRGQVLLCERWTSMYPDVKFVSCHPGWVDTGGVDAAFGETKKYLEPMRSTWQGCEGIIWLAVAPYSGIQGGEFYLDRSPSRKHIAGPFFTEGSFTKNSRLEVDMLMSRLQQWSDVNSRPKDLVPPPPTYNKVPMDPLTGMERPVDIYKFMGRWYVLGEIRSFITRGTVNNIEEYVYDEASQSIRVSFTYCTLDGDGKPNRPSELKQLATITNNFNTEWALSVKLLVYVPISTRYLILDVDENYRYCLIGVPDRSLLWIMCRTPAETPLAEEAYGRMLVRARELGFDSTMIERVPYVGPVSEEMESRDDNERTEMMIETLKSFESAQERDACVQRINALNIDLGGYSADKKHEAL